MAEIDIFGTLNNATPEGVIAKAEQIKDSTQNKKQSEINADYKTRLETLEEGGGSGGGSGVGQFDPNSVNTGMGFAEPTGEIFNSYKDFGEEFLRNVASGFYSHAEGVSTTAKGFYSHAEGSLTTANGFAPHAEGISTTANGFAAHAQNLNTIANSYAQTSIGCYNTKDASPSPNSYNAEKSAFVIGNGDESATSDAFKVLFNGQTFADGEYSSAGADYAEMFEWLDGNVSNEDRVGRFVTLDGDKIRIAKVTDTYILGIVSAAPTIIGDNPMRWQGKYLNDKWGRPIYEDVEVTYKELEKQNDGTIKFVEKTRIDHVRKLNPEYNPNTKYIPRAERAEWDFIGMMGKLLVKQDGTLIVGSFCKSSTNGVATKSEDGYYVMKVIDKEQALILMK